MENYDLENSALHRKLQSKNEALKIMRAEVERYRTERDQFKLMAETIQIRYSAIKCSLQNSDNNETFCNSSSTLGFLLNQTREKNITLQTEMETLRQKLYKLQGDVKLLRNKNTEMVNLLKSKELKHKNQISEEMQTLWNDEKAHLINQLENLKKKNTHLQYDFRSLLDEKEEVITQRDAFKCKAHRLNHELSTSLKGDETVDIDALVLENKFLLERISNLESELLHEKKSSQKLQILLEDKRKDDKNHPDKQAEKLLNEGNITELPLKTSTINDLKALCLALLDNLNDKKIALGHQKKTNKLLAGKIAALEHRISKISGSKRTILSPSQFLLNGYTSSKVDEDLRIKKEGCSNKIDVESSESSSKSMISSEFENQTTSDVSAEYKQLSYIKILSDGESCNENDDFENQSKLEELPSEIQKLVDEAMRTSENSSIH